MIQVGEDHGGIYNPILMTYDDGVAPTGVGASLTDVLYCPYCRDMIIQIVTTGIGVLGSFTFTVEGNLDGSDNFGNLSVSDGTIVVSTNKTTILTYDGTVIPYVRISATPSALLAEAATYTIEVAFGAIS